MSDQRCTTCRWWEAPPSWQSERRGACQRVMPGHAPANVPFVDAATAHTRLKTPPGFGCSLWEGSGALGEA